MLNKTVTITTNTTTAIGNPVKARGGQMCRGTVYVQGTFGSGTAALVVSRDGQNTWIPVTDQTGSAISFSANGAVNYEIAPNDQSVAAAAVGPELGITTANTSGASIVVYHDDER